MKRAVLILGLMLATGSALADEARDRAKEHFLAGQKAFEQGEFDLALAEYTAAHRIDPQPDLLFNIAQCHRNLKDYDRAIFFLERYLKEGKSIPDRARIKALIADFDRRRSKERVVERVVTTTIATTATVTLPVFVEVEAPVHERAWFWGLMAGVAVVVGGAIAIAVVSQRDPIPEGLEVYDLRTR